MRMNIKAYCFLLPLLCCGAAVKAQDLEPRAYNNLPVGLTFLGLAGLRSDGELSPTPSSPLQDAELTIDTGLLALSHTFSLAGSSSKVDLSLGRTCYEGSAFLQGVYAEGRRCEYTDPRLKLTWNFYGAPAMAMKEFSQWRRGMVAGASLRVIMPFGTYDSDHVINAGSNRWIIRPGLGMSWPVRRWRFELQGAVSFFEDNDDGFQGVKKEQDPLYSANTHIIYTFPKRRWISLDANYFWGGESTVNGMDVGDRQENSRFGLTFSTPITPQQSIKFYASEGVVTRIGNDFTTLGVAWLYRF